MQTGCTVESELLRGVGSRNGTARRPKRRGRSRGDPKPREGLRSRVRAHRAPRDPRDPRDLASPTTRTAAAPRRPRRTPRCPPPARPSRPATSTRRRFEPGCGSVPLPLARDSSLLLLCSTGLALGMQHVSDPGIGEGQKGLQWL